MHSPTTPLTKADLVRMVTRGGARILEDAGGPAPPRRAPALAADLLARLRTLATTHGWSGQHTYNALGPDSGLQCILVREAVIFADVKDEGEPLTVSQRHWQTVLKATGQVEVYTWTMAEWPAIQARLTRRIA